MSCRIREVHRVIHHIAIPIERLWIARMGHDGIGTNKAPQRLVVEPGVVIVEAGFIRLLAGEFVRDTCK